MNTAIDVRQDRYQWRSGSRMKGDAGAIGHYLQKRMSDSGGFMRAEDFAQDAFDPQSPIYDYFDHDIEVAAYEWHKVQARTLCNSIVIVTVIPTSRNEEKRTYHSDAITIDILPQGGEENGDAESENLDFSEIPLRAFPSVYKDGARYYTPLQNVLRDGVLKDAYEKQILKDLLALARKAANFQVFSNVVQAIHDLEASVTEQAQLPA